MCFVLQAGPAGEMIFVIHLQCVKAEFLLIHYNCCYFRINWSYLVLKVTLVLLEIVVSSGMLSLLGLDQYRLVIPPMDILIIGS